MTLDELYELCSNHPVYMAELDGQLVVDLGPNLDAECRVLGEIHWGDIILGVGSPGKPDVDRLIILPNLPDWCRHNLMQIDYYSNWLKWALLEYLDVENK